VFLIAVIVPLNKNSDRIDRTTVSEVNVRVVAPHWAPAEGYAETKVGNRPRKGTTLSSGALRNG
jgi:hypothetical protein